MAFQTVTCEVRWIASIGYSGCELPPSEYKSLGEFEDKGDAERALAEAGLTRREYGWRSDYGYGRIVRYLKEVD